MGEDVRERPRCAGASAPGPGRTGNSTQPTQRLRFPRSSAYSFSEPRRIDDVVTELGLIIRLRGADAGESTAGVLMKANDLLRDLISRSQNRSLNGYSRRSTTAPCRDLARPCLCSC